MQDLQTGLSEGSDPTRGSPSPVDYRIAIGDECDIEFRQTVLQSGSNTNSAIYFRNHQLKQIADVIGIELPDSATSKELRFLIRKQLPVTNPLLQQADISSFYPKSTTSLGVATDGGIKEQTQTPTDYTKPFEKEELNELSGVIGANVSPPYREPQIRKFVGSGIAGPYLASILSEAYVDPYLSINVGSTTCEHGSRAFYPYRLEPVHGIPDSATDHPKCFKYIVDSSVGKEEYGNQEALDTAHRVNADAVILADVLHDMDATVEKVVDGLLLYENHDFSGEVIVPLQAPHDECYKQLRDRGVSADHAFALGGLKDCNSDPKKIKAARSVREVAPEDTTLHGLGFGITDQLASAIRDSPNLLDSLDYSTPAQTSITDTMSGDQRLCTVAARAGAQLIEDIRKVSSLVDGPESTQLTDF